MIHQSSKDVYFRGMYLLSFLLRPIYRIHFKYFGKKKKLHIGCGPLYLTDFANIDGNFTRENDYCLDVRGGLPFPDGSMNFIYSCHMLEHVYVDEAVRILREWYRVLAPGGYIRLTLPDFNTIVNILAGEQHTFPRSFRCASGQAVNFLFCDGQHKYAYTEEMIEELAMEIGFGYVERAARNHDANIVVGSLAEPDGSFSVNIYKAER